MDHPFLVLFVILAVVWAIGMLVEKFHEWAKPAAVLAFIALILDVLWRVLR